MSPEFQFGIKTVQKWIMGMAAQQRKMYLVPQMVYFMLCVCHHNKKGGIPVHPGWEASDLCPSACTVFVNFL